MLLKLNPSNKHVQAKHGKLTTQKDIQNMNTKTPAFSANPNQCIAYVPIILNLVLLINSVCYPYFSNNYTYYIGTFHKIINQLDIGTIV